MMSGAFEGFTPDTWAFLDRLAAHNDTTWFDANRPHYRQQVAAPCKALVADLAGVLPVHLHPDVHAEAAVGRSLFRINRDVRFAKDKTPYKTHLDFLFWVGAGAPRSRPGYIMRLTSDSVLVGGGQTGLRGAELEAYRAAVADDRRGRAVRQAVDRLLQAGAQLSEPDRTRIPSPYARDHANAELLRRDGFHLSRTSPQPTTIGSAAFTEWCATALKPFTPVVDWLAAVPSR